jgi:circadian clock protein KaiB
VNAPADDTAAFEHLLDRRDSEGYVLQLFVSGMSPRSTSAIRTIKALCEEMLPGRYALEIVDLYDHPQSARVNGVLASPTLVRQRPLPVRRLLGDLSDRDTVLRTLGLG